MSVCVCLFLSVSFVCGCKRKPKAKKTILLLGGPLKKTNCPRISEKSCDTKLDKAGEMHLTVGQALVDVLNAYELCVGVVLDRLLVVGWLLLFLFCWLFLSCKLGLGQLVAYSYPPA